MRTSLPARVGTSKVGFTLFLGRRDPRCHFLAAMQDLAEKTERLTHAGGSMRTGSWPGGRRWGGDSELRLPPRGHWAGSEGGGREISLTGS